MAGKVHGYCSLGLTFYVKEIIMESVIKSILYLANIFNVASYITCNK